MELSPEVLDGVANPDTPALDILPLAQLTAKGAPKAAGSEHGQLADAQKQLQITVADDPSEPERWLAVAELLTAGLTSLPPECVAEREQVHGGLGYCYDKAGNAEQAKVHLDKSLPFDLRSHPATKTRIAREMMSRVALDFQAYNLEQASSRGLALSCLPPEILELQLKRVDGVSQSAVSFASALGTLLDIKSYLEFVKSTDMAFLEAATTGLIRISNAVPLTPGADLDRQCVFLLQRNAWYRPEITFSFLTACLLSNTFADDLLALNPFLQPSDITDLETMTVGALFRANRASWINICQNQLRKTVGLINMNLMLLVQSSGYDLPDARLACSSCKFSWRVSATTGAAGEEQTDVAPLLWLREREDEFTQLCKASECKADDPGLLLMCLRYAGYDARAACVIACDDGELARLKASLDRRCCDTRGARVRDETASAGAAAAKCALAMKTNILMLKDSTKSLAGLLKGKRVYASLSKPARYKDAAGKVHDSAMWKLDPRVLVFEYKFGYMLRSRQYQLTAELEQSAMAGSSRCNQMIMGAGKTTVIGPLLAMMLSGASTPCSNGGKTPKPEGSPGSNSAAADGNGKLLIIQCVPGALLEMSINVMRSVFNNVIDKDVLTLTFKRTLDPKVNDAEIMFQKMQRAHNDHSIICTTPDVVKSIGLKFIELILTNTNAPARRSLQKVLQLWKSDTLLLMDEVDLLLHPLKSELNFPIGEKQPYDMSEGGDRWNLPIFVLDFVFIHSCNGASSSFDYSFVLDMFPEEVKACEQKMIQAIEDGYQHLALQRCPHLVLLSTKWYNQTLKPILVTWLSLWVEMKSRSPPDDHPTAVVHHAVAEKFLAEANIGTAQSIARAQQAGGVSDQCLKLLTLGREWILTFVPHCLSKVNRVSYGLLRQHDLKSMPATMAVARKVVAVPFVGKDVPSKAAEFAHPEVLIGLTVLAYRYEGLRTFDIHEVVTMTKQMAVREVGQYEHRKASKMFQRWVEKSTAAAGTKPEIDLQLRTIQIEEPKQMTACWATMRHLPELVYHFLTVFIFPRTMHSQINKISASGQALGSDLLFKQRIGFSGTPSSLLPTELQPCHFEVGSEGKIVSTLCNHQLVKHTIYPKVGKNWTVKGLLKHIANGGFEALIDTGAIVTGMSNLEVARFLLDSGLRGKHGCVFLDGSDRKMILMRDSNTPQPLNQSGVPWDRRFSFYDQIHTTGMDIKQDLQATAAITIGKDMTLRDYAQGAWRMRGLGKGQTLHIYLVGAMLQLIGEALGHPADKPAHKVPANCVAFLMTNSCRLEKMQDGQLAVQNLGTTWQKAGLVQLRADTGRSAPGAAAFMFREPLDSSVLPIPASSMRLDQQLRGLRDTGRVDSFIQSLPAEARARITEDAEAIIATAATDNVLVDKNDLNSEMVREREQEQEQEQEREQQAVSITSRDRAAEEPWSIALLQAKPKSAGQHAVCDKSTKNSPMYPLAEFGVPALAQGDEWTADSIKAIKGKPTISLVLAGGGAAEDVLISQNVAVRDYDPQLNARRIKSCRLVLQWKEQGTGKDCLAAISLAEASALRARLHQAGSGGASYSIIFPSGKTVDCAADFAVPVDEAQRSLLRFFNSETWCGLDDLAMDSLRCPLSPPHHHALPPARSVPCAFLPCADHKDDYIFRTDYDHMI